MVLLFFVPVINGVICGAFGGWPETIRAKAVSHSLWAAIFLFPLLWIQSQYGAALHPFVGWNGEIQAGLSVLAMMASSLVVSTVRTTRVRTMHRAI